MKKSSHCRPNPTIYLRQNPQRFAFFVKDLTQNTDKWGDTTKLTQKYQKIQRFCEKTALLRNCDGRTDPKTPINAENVKDLTQKHQKIK